MKRLENECVIVMNYSEKDFSVHPMTSENYLTKKICELQRNGLEISCHVAPSNGLQEYIEQKRQAGFGFVENAAASDAHQETSI